MRIFHYLSDIEEKNSSIINFGIIERKSIKPFSHKELKKSFTLKG